MLPSRLVRLAPDAGGIQKAAELLSTGACVAFPTETVYGLGADATNDRAVAGIFEAKERPSFNPLIIHVGSLEEASRYAEFDIPARQLATAFWPGALTLVLPLKPDSGISPLVTAGGSLVAVRVPDHPVAKALMSAFGRPIAAPSANPAGRISPTTADHVAAGLGDRIAAVIDGGPTDVGVESTIVGTAPPHLLRPGGLPLETIEAALGSPLEPAPQRSSPSAPGQLASHYAPAETVRLGTKSPQAEEFMIGLGAIPGDVTLSPTGDLREAAARLFSLLHEADTSGRPIAVAPVPDSGLGRAINDRLRRAAAPRS